MVIRGSDPEVAAALRQVLAQCEHITSGGRDRFLAPDLDAQILRLAAERIVITLQAAIEDLPDGFVDRHDDLPFIAVRGMRNRLAHGYVDINAEVVWETIAGRLPRFVRDVIERLEAPPR